MIREIVNPDAQAALLLTDEACKQIGIHPKALTFVHIAAVVVAKPGNVQEIIEKILNTELYNEVKTTLIQESGLEDALPLIERGKVSFTSFRKPISTAIRSAVKLAMNRLPDKTSYQVDEARLLDACVANSKIVSKAFESVGWGSKFTTTVNKEIQSTQSKQTIDAKSYPMLHDHGVCMTERAAAGELEHIVGREREVKLMIQTLGRKLKRNPILVGEPGVGKTAVVEKLAYMIISKDSRIPETMKNSIIYSVSLGSLVAGTQYRGQFEDRIKQLIDEVKSNPNIIMFIDEFHTIVGAGGAQGSVDAASMLMPGLARGEISIIGATTFDNYQKSIEKARDLERRLQPIIVNEPNKEEMMLILQAVQSTYESYHSIIITQEALQEALDCSARYYRDKKNPDRTIDIIDNACSYVKIRQPGKPKSAKKHEQDLKTLQGQVDTAVKEHRYSDVPVIRKKIRNKQRTIKRAVAAFEREQMDNIVSVTDVDVMQVVANLKDVPNKVVATTEAEKLLSIEKTLGKVVIGQAAALDVMSDSIRRNRAGIRDTKRPIGVFLFLGPTGCGKCHGKGTEIIMYDGSIKKVEDIKVGEQLMGSDSTPRNVLSLARGTDQMYRITPVKGNASFTCNEAHILSLQHTSTGAITSISVKEYLSQNKEFKHLHKLYRTAVRFKSTPILCDIEPYFIGLWLGDGTTKIPAVTTNDSEIIEYLKVYATKLDLYLREDTGGGNRCTTYRFSSGNTGQSKQNVLIERMRHYGLLVKNNPTKFIPDEYLKGSEQDRKQLFAGLIDSDGHFFRGCYEITQKSEKLAQQIIFLARSLGYQATIRIKITNGTIYYRMIFSGEFSDLPVKVQRKKANARSENARNVLRYGFTIEHIGEGEYFGFEIDGNHLYLLGDFTVTHNTHSAKKLAEHLFDDEESMIRVDMAEYQEAHSVSKLTGPPPGYIGYDDSNDLVSKVRRKPYGVILFDEIEKAHPSVYNVLLGVFDDGTLTDTKGNKADFRNFIIIMTSNIGGKRIASHSTISIIEQESEEDVFKELSADLKKMVENRFSPEFINRLDDMVVFKTLNKKDQAIIAQLIITDLCKNSEYNMILTTIAADKLVDIGFSRVFGARALTRAIKENIESPMARHILAGKFKAGDTIHIDWNKEFIFSKD